MPKTRTLLSLVLVPLLVFLVACGGDDDDGGNGATSNQPSTSSSDSSSSSGSSNSGSSSSNSGPSSSDASGADILAKCPELLNMFGAFSSGAFVNPSAGGANQDLQDAAAVFQNAADNAPDEIKDDMKVLADAFTAFYVAIDEIGINFNDPASFASMTPSQQAQFQAAVEAFGSADLEKASDNLDQWFTENCE